MVSKKHTALKPIMLHDPGMGTKLLNLRQFLLKHPDNLFFRCQVLSACLNKAADLIQELADLFLDEFWCQLVQELKRETAELFPKPDFLLIFFPFLYLF